MQGVGLGLGLGPARRLAATDHGTFALACLAAEPLDRLVPGFGLGLGASDGVGVRVGGRVGLGLGSEAARQRGR
jgi:hypothetical protein